MKFRSAIPLRFRLVAALVALELLGLVNPAYSVNRSTATATGSVSAGRWAAVTRSVGSSTTAGSTPFPIVWATTGVTKYLVFELANTGSFPLSGASIVVPIGAWTGATTATIGVTFSACIGANWSAAATPTCAGTTQTLATITNGRTTGATLTVTSTLTSGSPLSIRIAATSNRTGTYTITPSVSIVRTRVRLGQTLSS